MSSFIRMEPRQVGRHRGLHRGKEWPKQCRLNVHHFCFLRNLRQTMRNQAGPEGTMALAKWSKTFRGFFLLIPLISPSGIPLSDLQMREATASEMASLQSWTFKGDEFGDPRKEEGETQRIRESYYLLGWKRPWRSSSPTISLALQRPPLNHVPKCHIYTSFKYLQGCWLSHHWGAILFKFSVQNNLPNQLWAKGWFPFFLWQGRWSNSQKGSLFGKENEVPGV